MAKNNDELKIVAHYYRQGIEPANKVIEKLLRDSSMIVHGGKAINAYLPKWLDRATEDWDVFSEDAEDKAQTLEMLLDERYGGDYFKVEPALHMGTYRVKSKVTGRVIADITFPERKIKFHKIKGINYASLEYHERKIERVLADPEIAFRHSKDRDALQRIRIYKLMKKQKALRAKRSRDTILPSLYVQEINAPTIKIKKLRYN